MNLYDKNFEVNLDVGIRYIMQTECFFTFKQRTLIKNYRKYSKEERVRRSKLIKEELQNAKSKEGTCKKS